MILINKTKGLVICKNLQQANGLKDKVLGLLDSTLSRNLLFKTRWGIHTFGLKMPIDVVILNDNFKVVKIKENLKPYQLFFWKPIYKNVVELEKGLVKTGKIEIGDKIVLES